MNYILKENLLLQAVADETVILDPVSGNYYTLDVIGTRMIELLRDTDSLESTVDGIVAEYETSAANVRSDLTELLESMAEHGLVEKTDT